MQTPVNQMIDRGLCSFFGGGKFLVKNIVFLDFFRIFANQSVVCKVGEGGLKARL